MKINESFVYLGRYFDFDMTNKDHKDILILKTNELLNTICFAKTVSSYALLAIGHGLF